MLILDDYDSILSLILPSIDCKLEVWDITVISLVDWTMSQMSCFSQKNEFLKQCIYCAYTSDFPWLASNINDIF